MVKHKIVCPRCGKVLCHSCSIKLISITCKCGYTVRFTKKGVPTMDYTADLKAKRKPKKAKQKGGKR